MTSEKIDHILADFRSWLEQVEVVEERPATAAETVDLHTLVSQFIALRHEVNLQTRATRSQQEQNSQTLDALQRSLEELRQAQAQAQGQAPGPDPEQAAEARVRPLLKVLLDLTDLMTLAGREVGRVQSSLKANADAVKEKFRAPPVLADLETELTPAVSIPPPPVVVQPSLWQRLFGKPSASAGLPAAQPIAEAPPCRRWEKQREQLLRWFEERSRQAEEALDSSARLVESVLAGYTMSRQRLQRALDDFGLEPIECEGGPFDPETMEVVEAVGQTGLPAGEVIEEVRRGYLWRGRVFRYAQVKVARS